MQQEYKAEDFVQVWTAKINENGEPYHCWRNALYAGYYEGGHVVIYTDGSREVLDQKAKIRKVEGG